MKIEFDTTWPQRSAQTPPSTPPVATQTSAQDARPATDIQRQTDHDPLVRPEKVAAAQALVQDENYPPNYLLDCIANLLSGQIK
jgi:hypothetical protein